MRLRSGSKYTAAEPAKESTPNQTSPAKPKLGKKAKSASAKKSSAKPSPNSKKSKQPPYYLDDVNAAEADTLDIADLDFFSDTDSTSSTSSSKLSNRSRETCTMEDSGEFNVTETVSRLTGGGSLSESSENLDQIDDYRGSTPPGDFADGDAGVHYRGNHSIYNNANSAGVQHQDGLQHPMGGHPGGEKLRPHNKWVVRGLRATASILVFFYFIIPTFIKLNPWVMSEVTFLSRVSWPPFINLSNPEDFRLNFTRHFRLEVNDEVTLGVWHILPVSFHKPDLKEKDFDAALKSGRPIIIYLHGNAGTRGGWHRVQLYKLLAMQDVHVFPVDYRGFADSTGSPTEEGVCEDGLAMYRYIKERSADSPVFIWGHSLGSAIATKVAKEISDQGKPLGGLVLEAPFNNIIDAAFRHPFSKPFTVMPWFSWAFIEGITANGISFATDQSLLSVTAPALILHAEDDGIVPYDLGVRLYDTAKAGKLAGGVQFASFDGHHGYGHKHLHKAANLPAVIRDFIYEKQK